IPVNFLKNGADPVVKSDDEYPDWLWNLEVHSFFFECPITVVSSLHNSASYLDGFMCYREGSLFLHVEGERPVASDCQHADLCCYPDRFLKTFRHPRCFIELFGLMSEKQHHISCTKAPVLYRASCSLLKHRIMYYKANIW
ncbi:unnamed protein product, partial [Discosporangium mesarthrocarpum]